MILRSDPLAPQTPSTGLSLLEALIALAILAMVMGLAATGFRGPSPMLRLQKEAVELIRSASTLRQRAIRESKTLNMGTGGITCENTDISFSFFPDGTAIGPDLCLTTGTLKLRLTLNSLTGRLGQVLE